MGTKVSKSVLIRCTLLGLIVFIVPECRDCVIHRCRGANDFSQQLGSGFVKNLQFFFTCGLPLREVASVRALK